MEREELKATLTQLHQTLSQSASADPKALELLGKLTTDINRMLDQDELTTTDEPGFSSGLRDLMLKFEADHPELSITLGKVADGLAAIGI